MFYVLEYSLSADYLEKRAPLRGDHLSLIKSFHASGDLQMAGAFDDTFKGTLLIFKSENTDRIEEFVKKDPYYQNGLIKSYSISKWNCVLDQSGMLI